MPLLFNSLTVYSTAVRGIEEYLISVINGLIGVYPYPPIALDKYPKFTIGEAQLAAFQSSMTFGSVCSLQLCRHSKTKGLKSLEKEWSLYPDSIQLMKVMLLLPTTSAQAKRSISQTRRIKTWLRSTMLHVRQEVPNPINWLTTRT